MAGVGVVGGAAMLAGGAGLVLRGGWGLVLSGLREGEVLLFLLLGLVVTFLFCHGEPPQRPWV
ncbi:hypothetical protein RDMS_01255 [Deinococcus sp. RL]|nr:hypothetical protein RDMS_01255 [Deinococcus sp. RL]